MNEPRPTSRPAWLPRWSVEAVGTGLSWAVPVGALLLGAWMLNATWQQQSWVARSFAVRFRTTDASGIWPGVNVTLSGFRVGRVEKVALGMDGKVAVDLRIAETYRRLVGPASRAERYQEGLIGASQIALTPDVLPPGKEPPRSDLLIPFEQGPDLAQLLEEIAATRLKLNRTLEGTATVAERDVPRAINSFQATMQDLRRLSSRLELETGRTAATTRQTLQVYEGTAQRIDNTGAAARKATEEALALMRDAHPPLVDTLREVRALSLRLNLLLESFGVKDEPPQLSPPGTRSGGSAGGGKE
ncbi:MlaD family protein [Synechococcus sp. 1G10]|uniref:MlaD family protein n=1 Tax=Synechococcus sp. 1G10 TaxID=2025605 RepID=UPI00130366E8|nr:MlaD family protein [Synechococcus sp. 1G10]